MVNALKYLIILAVLVYTFCAHGAEAYDCAANWRERVKIAGKLQRLRERAEAMCPRGPYMNHCDDIQKQASSLLDRQLVLDVLAEHYHCPMQGDLE